MHSLIKNLNGTDEAARLYAVQDIAEMAELEPALHLGERLAVEESRAVRDAIVFQLKQLDCSEIHARLFKLFSSPDAYLRNAAVDIFGAGGDEALGFLTAHLDHSNREVRKLILDALFVIGSPAAVLAIRAGLHDDAINVRITAVEYLGRLEDRESAPEMIALIEDSDNPMVITAVLESLPHVASQEDIADALEHLMPGGDMELCEPLFVPEVLHLVARSADEGTLCRVLGGLTDLAVYAEDFLGALEDAQSRYPQLACNEAILKKMLNILENTVLADSIRHTAAELLINRCLLQVEDLERLGMRLAEEPGMAYSAVRFLAQAGTDPALDRLREIMNTVRDDDLRRLCAELIEPENSDSSREQG